MMRKWRRGFTLIELLVVIAIIGVLVALLLPAVQAAREAARRLQCINNLKQMALATANYSDCMGSMPMNGFYRPIYTLPGQTNAHGFTLPLLPYMEQKPLYDSYNINMNALNYCNGTANATGVGSLWCPSDSAVSRAASVASLQGYLDGPTTNVTMQFSSYGSNAGMWFVYPSPTDADYSAAITSMNGVMFLTSSVRIADITDGTSNTLLIGERAHGLIGAPRQDVWSFMFASIRTSLTTQFPMNPQRRAIDAAMDFGSFDVPPTSYLVSASSFHPGGCNFAFVDGSVKFIKESIDSWPLDPTTGSPTGLSYAGNLVQLAPGTRPRIYQALSTRAGGEVISADAY